MRINKFIAQATGMSRRAADRAIAEGRVAINGGRIEVGTEVAPADTASLDGKPLTLQAKTLTIILNKPVGYVVSRDGQGSKTVYDLLPPEYHHLKPIGRLDKDSSGLLLLTNDGNLANELTHPKYQKEKIYQVELDKPLSAEDKAKIEQGIQLEDGLSKLTVISTTVEKSRSLDSARDNRKWTIKMQEGRNRQIRRTFAALGYTVTKLHRTHFGTYALANLPVGSHREE